MSQETENFDSLRRLMKLKRYEQPPPRYFKDFSSQVIARISAEQERQPSWLDRFASIFHARPALSGVLGAAACVLLLGTAVYSEGENAGVSLMDLKHGATGNDKPSDGTVSLASVSSTNLIRLPGNSLFDLNPIAPALPASFR